MNTCSLSPEERAVLLTAIRGELEGIADSTTPQEKVLLGLVEKLKPQA